MAEQPITHHVEVYPDERYLERLAAIRPVTEEDRADAFAWRVVCSDPKACPAWRECPEPHNEDPEDFDYEEDVLLHGVAHNWLDGMWTVVSEECAAEASADEPPDEMPRDRPGRYLVDVEWEDSWSPILTLVEEP